MTTLGISGSGISEDLILDPTTEDAANTQLTLTDGDNGIDVLSQEYGQTERKRLFAGGADVEGERVVQSGVGNLTITLKVRCFSSTPDDTTRMRARIADLTQKVGKLARYGGTFKRTLRNGDIVTYDVQDADVQIPADHLIVRKSNAICTVTLLCLPYGRGPSSTYSLSSETTNPELVFTVAAPAGDVPALGTLEITEAGSHDQWFTHWGLQSHYYPGTPTASTTAALAYAGTALLALNGSTALAVTGAAGGTVLNQGTLTSSYTALCSFASSGTVYPTHIGRYGVWARLYMGTANNGTVTAALEWAQADLLNYTQNDGTVLDPSRKGQFLHTYLGQVNLEKVTTGVQRWDARIVAKSTTVGDDLAVNRIYLFPVDDGYGSASGVQRVPSPTSLSARDEFDQVGSPVLNGATATVGGVWTSSGAADFNIASSVLYRNATTGQAQTATLPVSLTATAVQSDLYVPAGTSSAYGVFQEGVIARYVDSSNYFAITVDGSSSATSTGRFTGVTATLVLTSGGASISPTLTLPATGYEFGAWYRVLLTVDAAGRWSFWMWPRNNSQRPGALLSGQHAELATGGTLASGYPGLFEGVTSKTGTVTTKYDSFQAWVPPVDAAIYSGKQLRVYHNRARREDSSGTAEAHISDYRGDYILVPPAQHGGSARLIVKACRNNPYTGADDGIDDISGQLTITPRYWQIPE